jgi:Putative Flp pilus-assembly TadE/G-like
MKLSERLRAILLRNQAGRISTETKRLPLAGVTELAKAPEREHHLESEMRLKVRREFWKRRGVSEWGRVNYAEDAMRRKSEAGQVLFTTAASLVVLMGFAGLAIDMGVLRYDKRIQQTAADAAAIAGANDLTDGQGAATVGAKDASATNGFTDGKNNVTVTVNNPPLSGPHAGGTTNAADYVEVLVKAVQPTFFMRVLGINNETITARAVATSAGGGANSGCLYTLGAPPSGISGNGTLNASTCGIVDNGNFNSGGLSITADTFAEAGSAVGGLVTCLATPSSCPTPNTPAAADPLSSLTPPLTPPPVGAPQMFNASNIVPGSTYSGITITSGTVNFPAGTYVISGGNFTVQGSPTITGTGVTFYFTNGATVNMSMGTPTIQLTAPSSGQYAGILFYQDPNDNSGPQLSGGNASQYNGVLYFPKALVTFLGSANAAVVVADSFALSGGATVNLQGNAGLPSGVTVLGHTVLVE